MENKGKCFSMVDRGQRNKSDMYSTPYSMTEQLLQNEKFDYKKTVLEPCCGHWAITKVLEKNFLSSNIESTDKNDGFDFFDYTNSYDYIITNPPFSLAFEFIQKSKEITKDKFAMLLPLSYLHGQKRYESGVFKDVNYPLTKVYVFTRYPLLTDTIREDGKYKTGMMVYCWFIWEKNNNLNIVCNPPVINWIDNNKYVLKKREA